MVPRTRGVRAVVVFLAAALAGCGSDGSTGNEEVPGDELIDVVLLIDRSGGLDEVAQALCDAVDPVTAALSADAIDASVRKLGISIDKKGQGTTVDSHPCLPNIPANFVDTLYDVAGAAGEIDDDEDWGPAVAVLSDEDFWRAGAVRLIVVIVDEAPQDGNKTEDPHNVPEGPGAECDLTDEAAIADAISRATAGVVKVSAILVNHSPEVPADCVKEHARALVMARGGTLPLPEVDETPGPLEGVLETIIRDALD